VLERFLVPEEQKVLVSEASIRAATTAIFLEMGLTAGDAETAADVLITSDLRGCESHGVSNMLRRYVEWYGAGELNPQPEVTTLRESAVSATLDADGGLGIQVGPKAMQMAVDKACDTGIGAVTVCNAGHFGMLAYYVLQALPHDMIGVAMVSAGGGVQVPLWGTEPVFGTQPIAWGAPAGNLPPFVFDVATTQVALNKCALTRRVGSQIEPGWITGLDGEPILSAQDCPPYGEFFLLPFGGTRENGGHKGAGFAAIADIMAGILSGNQPGFLAEKDRHSLFVMAIRIDAFIDTGRFKRDMDQLLERISTMRPVVGQPRVYYAGLLEHEETRRRQSDGIPYHREVVNWFDQISSEFKLGFTLT
jgi:LDH2 family malate/lactate/ureidoglycolate dehydrogenase